MATRRIDVHKDHGDVKVNCRGEGDFHVSLVEPSSNKDGKKKYIEITFNSWTIKISSTLTIIHCASKAKVKKRSFRIATRNGSLFFYNSTTDWYWYFRDEHIQCILDEYKIDRMINAQQPMVVLSTVLAIKEKDAKSSTEELSTLKYYGDDTKVSISSRIKNDKIDVADVTFRFKGFLIVEDGVSTSHRTIYLYHTKIRDLDLNNMKLISVMK